MMATLTMQRINPNEKLALSSSKRLDSSVSKISAAQTVRQMMICAKCASVFVAVRKKGLTWWRWKTR